MKVLIKYEVNLKDADLCLGCPFAYVKEKGLNYYGGCNCAADTLWNCHCLDSSTTRNKDKDKWFCKAYKVSLGQGQIPKRHNKCK